MYKEQGIALFDETGQLRDTYDVLKDLAEVWPTLTRNQQAQFALAQAGANQTQNFTALMDNFQVAIDATATAMDSAGSAMKENAAYMESLEAQTTQLKATFQDLSNNVIDKELISSVLSLANDALNALNTETGATITQWGLLTGVLTGGIVIYGQIAGKLISAGSAVVSLVGALKAGTATATMFTSAALPIAAALGLAVVAGWKFYDWLKDTNPTLEEATERLDDANTQLENNKARIEEINNLPWNERTNEILSEKDALEKENEELLNQIAHYQELRKEKIKAKYESPVEIHGFKTQYRAVSTWGAEQSFVLDPKQVSEYEEMGYTIERVAESAIYAGDALKNKLTENVKTLTEAMANGSIENLEYADIVYNDTVAALTDLAETSDDYKALLDQLNGAVEDYSAKEKLRAETIESTDAEFQELVAKTPELTSVTEQLNGAYYTNIEALKQLITTSDEYKNGRIADEYETTVATIENSKTRLAALKAEMSAIAEYGSTDSLAYQSRKDNVAAMNQAIYAAERKLLGLAGTGLHWTSSGTGGSSSGKTTTKKATDLALEQFKSLQKDLDHQKEMGLIKEEEYYDKLEELVKQYKAQATAHMKEYGLTVNQINQNMYQYEEEIYKGRKQLADNLVEQQKKAAEEAAEAQKKAAEEAAQAEQEALEQQKEALEKQKEDFETAVNYVIKQIDEEIDKLQDLRDQTEQYYDDKIDAVNKANDALEDQIQHEELLNNLAKAKDKQLYVFQNGQFQYVQDVEAIASAQAELDAYERDKALQKEVENLETLKEQALDSIDKQIEGWEKYKEEWSNVVDQYQEQQDKLIAEQVLGIDTEQENWNTRLTNLQNFVDKYNSILSQLNSINSGSSVSSSSGRGYSFSGSGGSSKYATAEDDPGTYGTKAWQEANSGSSSSKTYSVTKNDKDKATLKSGGSLSYTNPMGKTVNISLKKHALGTTSASGGLSLVGEQGPELRVLNPGDGVIPADATRNLWDWSSYNPKDLLGNKTTSNVFHFDNLTLPNVKDAQSFVNGLKQLAYQRAYKRA